MGVAGILVSLILLMFLAYRGVSVIVLAPLVALLASGLVAGFLWIAVRKSLEAASMRPSHDLAGLVGQIGEARTKVEEDGSVQVAGELWSARSEKPIAAGSPIRVVRRDGFVLIVEKSG